MVNPFLSQDSEREGNFGASFSPSVVPVDGIEQAVLVLVSLLVSSPVLLLVLHERIQPSGHLLQWSTRCSFFCFYVLCYIFFAPPALLYSCFEFLSKNLN